MSIKRSREVSRRPRDGGDIETKKAPEKVYKWDDDVVPRLGEQPLSYGAAYKYAKESLVEHPVFGKGLVTKVEGSKIEVLFQAGAKKLAQNAAGKDAPKAEPKPAGAAAPAAEPAPAAAPAAQAAPALAPAAPAAAPEPPKT